MKTSAFLIRVGICLLLSLIPLTELENWIFTARMKIRGSRDASNRVLILKMDRQDFRVLKRVFSQLPDSRGEPWQEEPAPEERSKADRLEGIREVNLWDPALFRESLRRLISQDPKAVLVTWHISNEAVESLNDPGAELLARNKKVLWASKFDSEGKFFKPPRTLTHRGNFGFNNLLADSDGVVRRGALRRDNQASITEAVRSLDPDNSAHPDTPTFYINFMGPAESVPSCRLRQVVFSKAAGPCADLKDKILLITHETEEYRTPLGNMTRAEILANEIDTIVNRHTIYEASWVEKGLLILAIILLGAFYIIYYPVFVSAIALMGTATAVIVVLFQLLFQVLDVYIPAANMIASGLITYLVFTGYRLAFQENLQWRSLKQAQYIRELDEMKSNFLSLVSHDLKTPIAKIQAVVERLKRDTDAPKDLTESIENSNNELKHYITSILNLSKIESQKVILNRKSNDINAIIQQTLKRLRPLAQNKSIHIEESLDPLFSIECDEDLMRQVIANLIDNAIKYSPPNSRVIVRSREVEGFVRVEIEDFGPGISKDQLPLMFRKFNRFLKPIQEPVKGTGLGLYLSKYFIELHGGSISVRSEEGKGTAFSFVLPLHGAAP